jgi:hypothetical protein
VALDVKVLGMGCTKCENLEKLVREIMTSRNLEGTIEHIKDPGLIASYGMLQTPALVINDQVKSAGKVPLESQILLWLQQASD